MSELHNCLDHKDFRAAITKSARDPQFKLKRGDVIKQKLLLNQVATGTRDDGASLYAKRLIAG